MIGDLHESTEIIFEEIAGLVPIFLRKIDYGTIWCELQAPEKLSIGEKFQWKIWLQQFHLNQMI